MHNVPDCLHQQLSFHLSLVLLVEPHQQMLALLATLHWLLWLSGLCQKDSKKKKSPVECRHFYIAVRAPHLFLPPCLLFFLENPLAFRVSHDENLAMSAVDIPPWVPPTHPILRHPGLYSIHLSTWPRFSQFDDLRRPHVCVYTWPHRDDLFPIVPIRQGCSDVSY